MKKLFLLSLSTFIIFSCSQKETSTDPFATQQKKVIEENFNPVKLLKTNEYIEKSSTETLFLFKAPKGAKIDFYIAKSGGRLKKKLTVENYDGNGLTLGELESGVTYDYKIKVTYNKAKLVSKVETFTKEALNITKERPKWAKDAVFYEIFVRSFYDTDGNGIGDLKGVQEKIPYLKELGVNAIWLMPINPSPSYHGYDVTNYKGIEEDYGTLEDFKALLAEAKKNNIKIIMDFVLNHSSSQHPWFKEAQKDINSPYRDYYVWSDEFDNTSLGGDSGQKVWHPKDDNKYFGIFWDGMPDLNYRNPSLRKDIKDATKFWLDMGVDGFRLDASKYIDPNNDVTQLWWHDFNSYIKSINKDAFIVGENWDNSVNYVAKFMESMDSSFNFNMSDVIVNAARGNDVDLMQEIQKRDEIYKKSNENFIDTLFLRNHDKTRLSNEVLNDIDKQKMAITILMTLPGTPFLYYGEELGQQGRKPDENLRESMDWYESSQGMGMTTALKMANTVANDGISYEEEKGNANSIFEYTKKILSIRKAHPFIINGKYTDLNLGYKINGYEITDGKEKLSVVHNSNTKNITVSIDGKSFDIPKSTSIIIKNGVDLLK